MCLVSSSPPTRRWTDSRMDRPSWNDTLHATFASCVPCLTCGASSRSSLNIYNGSDSDNKYINNALRVLAPSEEGWRDDYAAADANAISLHSHLGPGEGTPPHTPRHISLWGFNLFGNRRGRSVALVGGDDVLHSTATPGPSADDAPPKRSAKKRCGSCSGTAPGCEHGRPPRARGARARAPPYRISKGQLETEQDRRARRKARKKMRHLAAALAEPNTPEFEGFPCSGSGKLPPQPTFRASPSGYNGIPSPFM
ncbi:hypothetical protein B0H13DRAFT_2376591 [Mycena leptocephala]|nr:hypothetical protein B0H13DRAFT_2376591 [Mycena leptocephala]